jgi:alpha-tubulin suppressor-like RCC1 family protein
MGRLAGAAFGFADWALQTGARMDARARRSTYKELRMVDLSAAEAVFFVLEREEKVYTCGTGVSSDRDMVKFRAFANWQWRGIPIVMGSLRSGTAQVWD